MLPRNIPALFIFRRKLTFIILFILLSILLIIHISFTSEDASYKSAISAVNQQINEYLGEITKDQIVKQKAQEEENAAAAARVKSAERQITQSSQSAALSNTNQAVVVFYSKNFQLNEILESLRTFQLRTPNSHKYDFVVLLESRPSNALKSMIEVMTSSKVHLVNIRDKLRTPTGYKVVVDRQYRTTLNGLGFTDSRRNKIKHIQRFLTHDLFELPQMQGYEYFWLLNDATHRLSCDVITDPVQSMVDEDKKVGFMFFESDGNPYQIYEPIWEDLKNYHTQNNLKSSGSLSLITDKKTGLYNQCQLKSFGLIGHLPFFRSDEYKKIVQYLNDMNGQKYSLLTDAVIFTMAFASLLKKEDFKLFQGIGLDNKDTNHPLVSCPEDMSIRLKGKCTCNPIKDTLWEEYITTDTNSCISHYYAFQSLEIPEDITLRKQTIQEKKETERINAEQKQKEFDQILEEAGLPSLELQEGDDPVERHEKFDIESPEGGMESAGSVEAKEEEL